MSGATIKVEGLERLRKKLGNIPQVVTNTLDVELHSITEEYVDKAVSDAPVDMGRLKGGITSIHETLDHEVVSKESYSAFVEFGTRTRVSVPADLASYASQFKGAGNKGDVKKLIFEWCKRKGIPKEAWYPIFIKIMTVGINPHPFFFPHLPWAKAEVIKRSQQVVEKALKG